MKILFIVAMSLSGTTYAQPYDGNFNFNNMYYVGAGIGANPGMLGGGVNPNFTAPNGESLPIFESTAGGGQFNLIKPNANCPLLTQTAREDQDAFLDIKNFLNAVAKKPECGNTFNPMLAQMNGQSISMLETLLGNNSSGGVKCYSKNVEQLSQRNMAYYYAEKGIEQSMSSAYNA